jgi:hypothetical protein
VKKLISGLVASGIVLTTQIAPAHATTLQETVTDPSCVSQVTALGGSAAEANSFCTFTFSSTSVVALSSQAQSRTLSAAALSNSPINSITWTTSVTAPAYKEVQKGVAYFDGTYAWSTTPYRGFLGSHQCHASGSYAIGVSVSGVNCTTSVSQSGASIVERETYDLSMIFQGFPISTSVAFSALINCNGGFVERLF